MFRILKLIVDHFHRLSTVQSRVLSAICIVKLYTSDFPSKVSPVFPAERTIKVNSMGLCGDVHVPIMHTDLQRDV